MIMVRVKTRAIPDTKSYSGRFLSGSWKSFCIYLFILIRDRASVSNVMKIIRRLTADILIVLQFIFLSESKG